MHFWVFIDQKKIDRKNIIYIDQKITYGWEWLRNNCEINLRPFCKRPIVLISFSIFNYLFYSIFDQEIIAVGVLSSAKIKRGVWRQETEWREKKEIIFASWKAKIKWEEKEIPTSSRQRSALLERFRLKQFSHVHSSFHTSLWTLWKLSTWIIVAKMSIKDLGKSKHFVLTAIRASGRNL